MSLLCCPTTRTVVPGGHEKVKSRLKKCGIRRILFQSKTSVDPQTLEECRSAGVETAVACPLMFRGSFRRRIYGFFAGV